MFAFLWLLVGACAWGKNPPQKSDSAATLEVVNPNHVYTRTTNSLSQLDFRNFRFHVFDEDGKSFLTRKLRNGKYDSKEHIRDWRTGDGYDWLGLDWVRFVGENSEFAIVSFSWVTTGGSASDFGVVQVFTQRDGHPIVVQQILFNTRKCGTSADLSTHPLLLTIEAFTGGNTAARRPLTLSSSTGPAHHSGGRVTTLFRCPRLAEMQGFS
ncbi:MAG TPA: hypothetical protein VGJ33_09420 [Candidatus Angelobacter sp.]|jgi:hypothetical protein